MNPLDLRGPQFLALYIALFAVAAADVEDAADERLSHFTLGTRHRLAAGIGAGDRSPPRRRLHRTGGRGLRSLGVAARLQGLETGHLLPVPRTRESLELVVAHLREAKAALPIPLAVENIAALFDWPNAEMDEAAFLTEALEQADVRLLLDLENVYANARNHGHEPRDFLDRIPLDRVAYAHVAGGVMREGL